MLVLFDDLIDAAPMNYLIDKYSIVVLPKWIIPLNNKGKTLFVIPNTDHVLLHINWC